MSVSRSFFAELESIPLRESPRIAAIIARAGEDWSELNAVASSQEEQKKNYLAKLTLDYLESGRAASTPGGAPKAVPMNQAELRALADPRYDEYIKNMVDARRRSNIARVRYDTGKMFVELQRSTMATQRQELKTLDLQT